jgi:two-component system, NtrC family, sensor histidine kinase PilS
VIRPGSSVRSRSPRAVGDGGGDRGADGRPVWADTWFEPDGLQRAGSVNPAAASFTDSLSRIAGAYTQARVALALALLGFQVSLTLTGTPLPGSMWLLTSSYAAAALLVWWLTTRPPGHTRLQLLSAPWSWLTMGLDLLHFGALDLNAPAGLVATPLMALPVLMTGIFWQRVEAIGTAAGVALFLLFRAFTTDVTGEAAALLHARAGLAGLALMSIAWFSHAATRRLLLIEQQGRDSQALARQQGQIRQLVIDELSEGVLVVDRRGRLRAHNPAAGRFLGIPTNPATAAISLGDGPAWRPLADAVERGYADGEWPQAGRLVSLPIDKQFLQLRLRIRFTREPAADESLAERQDLARELCVLLLEDERVVQARIQQEKLAAMGRLSAGVAHDIRNPLAAISQASALLGEEPLAPTSARLVKIIDTQVDRLSRLVRDVLDAVATHPGHAAAIALAPWLEGLVQEWAQGKGLPASVCQLPLISPSQVVRFDAEHLRRVLVNLLDNAWEHGRGQPGSILLSASDGPTPGSTRLIVWNDGESLSPEVESRLFEPFFSTRSQGTGLGLFLSRELCLRNGADLQPVADAPPQGYAVGFAITFPPLS